MEFDKLWKEIDLKHKILNGFDIDIPTELLDIYFTDVGNETHLIISIKPNDKYVFDENTFKNCMEFNNSSIEDFIASLHYRK